MSKARIAIVEDEAIVALDIEYRLKSLGYTVVGTADSGEEAVRMVESQDPDIVLMDIMLGGGMDGIEAATVIKDAHSIPVVYISAFADEATIERAKLTSPFGYLTKPFEDRELAITLEMAMYKHSIEHQLVEKERWLGTTLNSIGEAVVATDGSGKISFMNPMANEALGVSTAEALGQGLADIFHLHESHNGRVNVTSALAQHAESAGSSLSFNGVYSMVRRDGESRPVNLTVSPIRNGRNKLFGHVLVFRDISDQLAAKRELERSVRQLKTTLEETVNALASTGEKRDPYTAGHQQRVARLACAIAKEQGVGHDDISGIRVAAMLHDLGKISVPAEILSKPARLTDMEMGIMKTHSEVAHDILKNIPFPWPVATMVLQHHERIDGSGYPGGVHRDEMLPSSHIIAVSDVVEAMSSHRPYRPALGLQAALEEIGRGKGERYDAAVVDTCLDLFQNQGFSFEEE